MKLDGYVKVAFKGKRSLIKKMDSSSIEINKVCTTCQQQKKMNMGRFIVRNRIKRFQCNICFDRRKARCNER